MVQTEKKPGFYPGKGVWVYMLSNMDMNRALRFLYGLWLSDPGLKPLG